MKNTALWVLLIFGIIYSQNRKVCNGNWCIEWSDKKAIASSMSGGILFKIYEYENTEAQAQTNNGYWNESSYTMNSIVGTLVSYKNSYYCEGGAHPSYGSIFRTVNVATGDTLNLSDIFNEKDILAALKNDEFIKKSVSNISEIGSLEDFEHNTINTCEYYMSRDILISSFSFHHVKDSLVAVRIGIPYGCETDRGKFTQIGIYLPIPANMKNDFKHAVLNKTLMKDLTLSKK